MGGGARFLRALAFYLLAPLLTFFAWFLAFVALLPQPRRGGLAARVGLLWGRSMLAAAGGRLRVEGAERLRGPGPRMVVANHTSYLDPPVVMAVVPANLRFILKRELLRVPFVGWHAVLGGHFLLDRADPRAGLRLVRRAVTRTRKHGLWPIVFPEGTRSRDGRLQRLRAGAFELAVAGGIPVQPIAILGTRAILPRGARGPLRSGPVVARVGPPIPTEGLEGSTGRKALAERVREALLALGVPEGERERGG